MAYAPIQPGSSTTTSGAGDVERALGSSSFRRVKLRWLGLRVLRAAITFFLAVTITFFLFRVLGDPTTQLAVLPGADEAQVTELRAFYGLDKPVFPGQYLDFLGDLARLDLGTSQQTREPVAETIGGAIGWTLLLAAAGTAIALAVGTWMGVRAGARPGTHEDTALTFSGVVTYSAPSYWVGIILILLFAVAIPIFPTGQAMTPGKEFSSFLTKALDVGKHLVLPALTFALALVGEYFLIMRNSMIGVMHEEFIRVKRAEGIPYKRVIWRHGARNAALPVLTLTAILIGFMLGGTVVIETLFSWPGLGLITFQAIDAKDFPVLQATFLVFAAAMILLNLVADAMYFVLDPRVRDH